MISSIEYMKNLIAGSRNVVCLTGRAATYGTGCELYREEFEYELEDRYGRSLEEMFSASYYNNRTKDFFQFYRDEVLKKRGTPNDVYYTLAQMERDGKLGGIITRSIFSLASVAGCQNVINLHGSIYDNRCPHCNRQYDISYLMDRQPVPWCEQCGAIVRPQIVLRGEMVDNIKITQAADVVSKADLLLIIGSNMNSYIVNSCIKYFTGSKVLLLNWAPHYADGKADCVCTGDIPSLIRQIYP
ncbi:MAG: Sir2 family NAD-dependent protein deacetylase [Fusicatenibacter sp.]|nr:hypothetical protein [Fusicatenibacter sp.]